MKANDILLVLAGLLTLAASWVRGYVVGGRGVPEVQSDTVVVVDTHYIEKPVPVEVWKDREKPVYIAVKDTMVVHTHDTLIFAVERETKRYSGEDYKAQVSGVEPQLDWVEVYPRTTQVVKQVPTLPKWAISPSVSALLTPEVFGIGAGVQLDVWAGEWRFSPSIDCMLLQHNGTWTHGPAFTFKANYNLIVK